MAPGEPGTGEHGGQSSHAEALAAPHPFEGRHGLPEAVDRPTKVALGMIGYAEAVVRPRVQDDIPTGCGQRESTLGGGDGLVIRTHGGEIGKQSKRDLCQPTRAVEGLSEGLGLTQSRQATSKVARRSERHVQGNPEIDSLLDCAVLLRQMREGTERLIEVPDGLTVS